MSENEKLLFRILRGASDTNIPFAGLCVLLRSLGFEERIRGSHHIFTRGDIVSKERKIMDNAFRYEVIIYWSRDDDAFIAEVPELPGCAADGATHQEALANLELVSREWIETARELGRDVQEPKGRLMFA